jgi:hypothetical protein
VPRAKTNQALAAELGCTGTTVGKWRSRFVAKRLKDLAAEHRSGVPRTVTDGQQGCGEPEREDSRRRDHI